MPTMPADPEEVSSPLYKRWGVPPQIIQQFYDLTAAVAGRHQVHQLPPSVLFLPPVLHGARLCEN